MNCYTNYGKGSFAYFCEGYNQVSVGVTLIFRTTGGDNCISESAVAMTNDNYFIEYIRILCDQVYQIDAGVIKKK